MGDKLISALPQTALRLPSRWTTTDLKYIARPNRMDLVLTSLLAPLALTVTAFVVPINDDGRITFARHNRRGIEMPGGHVEAGETLAEAVQREALEETGCILEDLVPIGFQRHISYNAIAKDARHPHPVSYQQLFAARVVKATHHMADKECGDPVILTQDVSLSLRSPLRPFQKLLLACSLGHFGQEAARQTHFEHRPTLQGIISGQRKSLSPTITL